MKKQTSMFDINETHITAKQIILPLGILSFTVFMLMTYQTTQIVSERMNLSTAKLQQSTPYENSQKLQTQLSALITGTQKLANEGNKNAEQIVVKLKAMGVIGDPAATTKSTAEEPEAPAQVPAATEKAERGPIKP